MADMIELGEGFVRTVLDDNTRLRAEAANAVAEIATLKKQIARTEVVHRSEIYELVRAAGGCIETANRENSYKYDSRRLFIDRFDYERAARYRLVADDEQVSVDGATTVIAAPNGEDAHGPV